MRRILLLLALTAQLAFVAGAYAAEAPAAGSSPVSQDTMDNELLQTLQNHRWVLAEASDGENLRIDVLFPPAVQPYTFTFTASMLNVQGGCNSFGGSYQINDQSQLEAQQMRSSMMACEPLLMQADDALAALLAQPLQLNISEDSPPRLQLRTVSNETLVLEGEATPESLYGPGDIIFLEVDAKQLPCRNPRNAQTSCLQVRTINFDEQGLRAGPSGPWQPFYDAIDGYNHIPGERNVLRVKRFDRGAIAGDSAPAIYILDLIVETETVPQ